LCIVSNFIRFGIKPPIKDNLLVLFISTETNKVIGCITTVKNRGQLLEDADIVAVKRNESVLPGFSLFGREK